MKCPNCEMDVQMLKFTTSGVGCPNCMPGKPAHAKCESCGSDAPLNAMSLTTDGVLLCAKCRRGLENSPISATPPKGRP
jgi:primosomal protein N'